MPAIEALPITEPQLESLFETLGVTGEEAPGPFWDANGNWKFDGSNPLPDRFHLEKRIADWRELASPCYEGLENEDLAIAALQAGELPGYLVDNEANLVELFKDGAGDVYLRLRGVRTLDGHEPIFFFDHTAHWKITAYARSMPELVARQVISDFPYDERKALEPLLGPIAIDPASLAALHESFSPGWRTALGLPHSTEPIPPRRRRVREPVEGSTLTTITELTPFTEACVQRFILANAADGEALVEILHSLTWWHPGTFTDLDASLRNCMARIAASASQPPPADANERATRRHTRTTKELLNCATFLDGLLQKGKLVMKPSTDVPDMLYTVCNAVHERSTGARLSYGEVPETDDGIRLLDTVPQMLSFQNGWKGVVPHEMLEAGDHTALAQLARHMTQLTQLSHLIYNFIRRDGDQHVEAIEAALPTFLPYDQAMVLHGLDNFPKHEGVLALYDRVIASSPYDYVKEAATRYKARVASGVKPSGTER